MFKEKVLTQIDNSYLEAAMKQRKDSERYMRKLNG
jgi:hypothetical protein